MGDTKKSLKILEKIVEKNSRKILIWNVISEIGNAKKIMVNHDEIFIVKNSTISKNEKDVGKKHDTYT